MTNPPGILFDLDGTILDSESKALGVAESVLPRFLGRPLNDKEKLSLRGVPWVDIFTNWFPGKEIEIYELCLKEWDRMETKISVYEGIFEVIQRIHSMGLKVGVVSSKVRKYIEQDLLQFSLLDLMSVIVGSDETKMHKPHPEPLVEASRRLKLKPGELVYVGDQPTDIMAAKSAGMKSAGTLWGEGDFEVLKAASPDFMLENPQDIIGKIIK